MENADTWYHGILKLLRQIAIGTGQDVIVMASATETLFVLDVVRG